MTAFARHAAALLLAAALSALALAGCDTDEEIVEPGPPPLPQNALYVCNQSDATISVISTETNDVVRTLDLTDDGFSADAKPHHVVVEPDGSAFYVSLIGENAVAKFDRRGDLVGTVPFEAPGMLALGGDLLYATHTMSITDVPSTVAAIRRSDMTLAETVEVSIDRPHGVGVHPGGEYAYAGSLSQNRLAIIDTETQVVDAPLGDEATLQRYVHFALAEDGARLYATGQTAGQVRAFDVSTPAEPRLIETAAVGRAPFHPALSEDGQTLYVPNKGDNSVTVLDTETLDAQAITGEGLAQPHGSALSPDGRFLYVSNNNQNGTYTPAGEQGTVVVISTATDEIEEVIEVGRNPRGIGTRGGT